MRSGIVVLKQLTQEWVWSCHGLGGQETGAQRECEPKCNQNEVREHAWLPVSWYIVQLDEQLDCAGVVPEMTFTGAICS